MFIHLLKSNHINTILNHSRFPIQPDHAGNRNRACCLQVTSQHSVLPCSRLHGNGSLLRIIKPGDVLNFERIGLRYVNFISRKDLELEGVPFSELITSRYLLLNIRKATTNTSAKSRMNRQNRLIRRSMGIPPPESLCPNIRKNYSFFM